MAKPQVKDPNPTRGPQDQGLVAVLGAIEPSDFFSSVVRGAVVGQSIVQRSGRGTAPSGSWGHVNLLGTSNWQAQSASTIRVAAGGNANDTALGSGARSVVIAGLSDTLVYQTDAIPTNGASASTATTQTYRRVFDAYVGESGTYGAANVAAMNLERVTGATNVLQIAAGEGASQFPCYSIQPGKTAYLLSVHFAVEAGQVADFRLFQLRDLDVTGGIMASARVVYSWEDLSGEGSFVPRAPMGPYPAATDLWFEARGVGAAVAVAVDFELLLVDN